MSGWARRLVNWTVHTPDLGVAGILVLEIVILSLATLRTIERKGAPAGRAVGTAVARATDGQGACAVFGSRDSADARAFQDALRSQLQRLAPGLELLELGDPPFSTAAMAQQLAPHLDRLDAVITPHENAARSAERALTELGRDLPVLRPGPARVSLFLNRGNLLDVARAFSFIAIAAIGACMVIVTAGIDLSVGSLIGLSGVVTAYALKLQNESMTAAIAAGIAAGTLAGLANGLLIARWRLSPGALAAGGGLLGALVVLVGVRWAGWSPPLAVVVGVVVAGGLFLLQRFFLVRVALPPFIATLGMLSIGRGLAYWITGGQQITTFGDFSRHLGLAYWPLVPLPGLARWTSVPAPVAVMIALTVVGMLFLGRTVWGRRIYAVGGNETAARLAGVDTDGIKVLVYTIAGFLAAVSGVLYVSRFDYAASTAGRGYELQVIAACVIGGTSLAGGRGSVVGAVLGAAIMGVLYNGLTLLDVPPELVDMVIGTIIILAVTIDQIKKREAE